MAENFTVTFKFSRADFKTSHGKVHIFTGGIIKFSREEIKFSREKKNNGEYCVKVTGSFSPGGSAYKYEASSLKQTSAGTVPQTGGK